MTVYCCENCGLVNWGVFGTDSAGAGDSTKFFGYQVMTAAGAVLLFAITTRSMGADVAGA